MGALHSSPTDFLDDGYKALRDLVMDYAGITPNSLIQSTDSIAPSALQHPRMSARVYEQLGAVDESMQTFSGNTTTRSSSSQQHNADTTTVEETATTTTADTSAVSSNVQKETANLLSQYKEVPHGQAPPPIRSIQSVARSWSRPSTSMSHQSTSSRGRAVAGSSKVRTYVHTYVCGSHTCGVGCGCTWVYTYVHVRTYYVLQIFIHNKNRTYVRTYMHDHSHTHTESSPSVYWVPVGIAYG